MTNTSRTDREPAGAAVRERQGPLPGIDRWLRRFRRALLAAAAALIAASYFLPFWQITLHAPQYPDGLHVRIVGTGTQGDVSEVDELNHYIGMMRMEDLARTEQRLWPLGVALLVLVLLAAIFLRSRWAALLALGAATYPVVFAADLYHWLDYSGHHLDPTAPLSGAISPFMPAFVGSRMVGQFETVAAFGAGFWLAVAASVLEVLAAVGSWRGASRT